MNENKGCSRVLFLLPINPTPFVYGINDCIPFERIG